MTSRQLIHAICDTTLDLDAEIPASIIYRGEHGCGKEWQKINGFVFIDGKLIIEGTYLGPRKPF